MNLGKVLITGGAGCIGSDLAERLVAEGNEVILFDNFSTGKESHIEKFRGSSLAKIVHGDVQDIKSIQSCMEGVNFVFHLAANSSTKYSHGDPTDRDLKINIIGTYNVLESMRQARVKNIAFTSSQTVYGEGQEEFTESSALNPISLYGASKAACEHLIHGFCNMFDMRAWIFRFSNVVTGKTRKTGGSVIQDFIRKLKENNKELEVLGDGRQSKSYLHVEDCIDAMLFCLENSSDRINVFNVGTGDTITVEEIAKIVISEMKLNANIRYTGGSSGWVGDVPKTNLSIEKIKSIGWKPKYNSKAAVKKAVSEILKV